MTRYPTPREPVLTAKPAHHGAFDYAELEALGVQADDLVDFSVNSNPYGPSPAVLRALARVPLDRYPDRECLGLRRSLMDTLHVGMDQIVVGNGAAELISLVAGAYLRPATPSERDHVVIIGPTFGEYRRVSELMGAKVHEWRAKAASSFQIDAEAIGSILQKIRPRLFFLCNPNNPTGAICPMEAIAEWRLANPDTLFVIDEAYIAFAQNTRSALELGAPNLLTLRSMTKDHALAGLRLGYAVGPTPVVDAIAAARPAWNVNALAQAAGIAALHDEPHIQQSLASLRAASRDLFDRLTALGLDAAPSSVHYFIVNVGNGAMVRQALLAKGILVRDCASFSLPQYIRIATKRPQDNQRLLEALKEVIPCLG